MTLLQLAVITIGCMLVQEPLALCAENEARADESSRVAGLQETKVPRFSGNSLDVILTAEAALAWDLETGHVLYEKNADEQREVASISKLLSVLAVRQALSINSNVLIPSDILAAQKQGANIKLPVEEHVSVRHLLAASLISSANDAMVALAVATSGTEEEFVDFANDFAAQKGLHNTRISNSTGLPGGVQHSTARDVKELISLTYEDPVLRPYLSQAHGVLTTVEGSRREYKTTNQLAGTYLPVLAAKTGYTHKAKQNLTMISINNEGNRIGAVILGSDDRFQDMKVLVEWTWRNYTW